MSQALQQDTRSYQYDLGNYSREVTTTSADAQTWFDRGLVWCYAFNHEEAARCFTRAIEYDPQCAMAHWGLAYAVGPNYNKTWSRYDGEDLKKSTQRGRDALERGRAVVGECKPLEKALIRALSARFPATTTIPEDLGVLDRAYADAMRDVFHAFGPDLEIYSLYADSIMCIRPRQLWNLDTGAPTTPETLAAQEAIEAGFRLSGGHSHPGLNHLYIHLMEMSPVSQKALPAADRLRDLVPDGSHLQHMSTHIDIAVGDYRHAVESNTKAMLSDNAYFARETGGILYWAYRAHNVHVLTYAAMMSGRSEVAFAAARHLVSIVTPELLAVQSPPMIDWVEFHGAILVHTYVRFGRWEEILKLELPTDQKTWTITTAIMRYGRAVALGVLGRREEARAEKVAFEEARRAVPKGRRWGVTATAAQVLDVASLVCEGELEYREGNRDNAYELLRKAAVLEDGLPYSDPPLWMLPVRHALGALLLEQGHSEEAEEVYKQDLGVSRNLAPRKARLNNVWGLHGLHECLVRNGKTEEARALGIQRDIAMASSDISVAASCFCRVSAVEKDLGGSCCT